MDDGKRENNKIKRVKSDHVKSVVSVYLHRRHFASIKPRIISKKIALKRAALDTTVRRPNSTVDNFVSECDPLLVEYSFIFQKFIFWLKEQTNKKHRCYDLEKLVGPLFCHFYLDIRNSGKPQESTASSISFFKAHVEKVDKSKCDDIVKDMIRAISKASDNVVQNGSDYLNLEELKERFRSSKIALCIKPESLMELKKFVANTNFGSHNSHVTLLQSLQKWFDLRLVIEDKSMYIDDDNFNHIHVKYEIKDQSFLLNDYKDIKPFQNCSSYRVKLEIGTSKDVLLEDSKNCIKVKIEPNQYKHEEDVEYKVKIEEVECKPKVKEEEECKIEVKEEEYRKKQAYVNDQRSKIRSAIRNVRKLPATVCNIQILNNKNLITSGLIRSRAGLAAFAEQNILRVMPLQALVNAVYNTQDIDHIKFTHHSKQIYCITLCPNNNIICTASADHSICVYSLHKTKLLRRLFGHLGPVYSLAISENAKYLASGSQDGTARLWTLRSGKPLRVFAGHTDAITSVHFHPNTLYLASGSADRNVRVWCLNSSCTVRLLHAAKKEVYVVAFSPNGSFLACGSDDKKVRIWDLATSKVVHEFKSRESTVIHLLWSKDCKHLCGGTIMGVIKIWEVKDKDREHSKEHKDSDSVIRRSVNGRLLCLEYALGTWTSLSVPKQSPFDSL